MSYLRRELRSIPDVILVDESGKYEIQVIISEVMSGRSKLGIAMSVIVLMSVQETIRVMITIANHGFLKKYYVEKDFDVLIGLKVFGLISSVEQRLEVAYKYFPPYTIVHHKLITDRELKMMCQMIITDFDNDILEADRNNSQGVKIRFTQALLNKAGFDPGPVDGKLGKQTKIALRQYQSKYGLPVTGELDDATWESLAQFISR